VLGKLQVHQEGIEPGGLDAGIVERFAQASPLLGRAAAADLAAQYSGGGNRLTRSAVPNAAFAEFAKGHMDQIGCGLHDFGVVAAKAARQIALHGKRIIVGYIKLQMWHKSHFLSYGDQAFEDARFYIDTVNILSENTSVKPRQSKISEPPPIITAIFATPSSTRLWPW
jgi:hypothetical protein